MMPPMFDPPDPWELIVAGCTLIAFLLGCYAAKEVLW